MTVAKDLQALNKGIQAIEKKIVKLISAAGKGGTTKIAKKTRANLIKAKSTKRATAKKISVKKRTAQSTATDQVLKIINRSKKGVSIEALMVKTRFNKKKVVNILQRAYKMGKIKRVAKGVMWDRERMCIY